jgi:hypothetical protein
MFKGFIVIGAAFGVGYLVGYSNGQEHTKEFRAFLAEVRDSEETKKFLVELREALRAAGEAAEKVRDEEEEVEIVVESEEEPLTPSELDAIRDN